MTNALSGLASNIAPRAINTILAGCCRFPFLLATMGGTTIVAFMVLKGLRASWQGINSYATGFDYAKAAAEAEKNKVHKNPEEMSVLDDVAAIMNPFTDPKWTNLRLAKVAAVALSVGIVGGTTVSVLFGQPPAIYNDVLRFMGPIRLSCDLWPGFQAVKDYFHL